MTTSPEVNSDVQFAPSLQKTVYRARVADAIERGLSAGICWLAAPAGYGKTTAITDYLNRNGIRSLWVRLESADGDLGHFYRHLQLCLPESQRILLPQFQPKHLTNVREFAHRFFRAYLVQISAGCVVFDNLHRVDTPDFATTIETMLRVLPENLRCVCMGRSLPTLRLGDLIVAERLSVVDEDILRFTPREARFLIVQRLRNAASALDVSTAQGCAAGLVVLAGRVTLGDVEPVAVEASELSASAIRVHAPELAINVLGEFRLTVNGRVLDLGSKTPAKSLDALRALAISPTRSCSLDDLYEWLWPDADGDQAKSACDQALHRLRKLLGDAAQITQRDGKVQLNGHNLCIDIEKWEEALQLALRPVSSNSESMRAMEHAFRSFAGPVIQCGRSAQWLQSAAERVRGKFIELATRLARTYEMHGAHASSRGVYLRALDMYPTCGRCYESLIRGRLAQHDVASAIEDYRRYERMLRGSGVQPSVAIQLAVKQGITARENVPKTYQSFSVA